MKLQEAKQRLIQTLEGDWITNPPLTLSEKLSLKEYLKLVRQRTTPKNQEYTSYHLEEARSLFIINYIDFEDYDALPRIPTKKDLEKFNNAREEQILL